MRRLFVWFAVIFLSVSASAATLGEKQRIVVLLDVFETTPGLVFIAGGVEHNGAWAKKHLEYKYETAIPAVSTAREFIYAVASSDDFNARYTLRFSNGRLKDCGEWLEEKLQEMDAAAATQPLPEGYVLPEPPPPTDQKDAWPLPDPEY